jgi:hypothetical protein
MQKLGRAMSDAGITGSLRIWGSAQRGRNNTICEGEREALIEQEKRKGIEAEGNERVGEIEKFERSEVSLEAVGAAEGERKEGRQHEGNERPVEAEKEKQGEEEEPNTQQRVMTVGQMGQPATDDDPSDQLF